jgi:hypothetical protein
VENEGE